MLAAAAVLAAGLWLVPGRWWGRSGSLAGAGRSFNVLLITLDTTRADCLGCYGHPVVKTPRIDALANEGVRFTQCTASAPITLPSHASIMTATYPFVHRARTNGGYLVDEGNATLAELLRQAGYATGAEVGAYVLDAIWGIDQGFSSYRSGMEQLQTGTQLERLAAEQSVPADAVCDRALEWLGQHGAEQFFLWVHLYDPHHPWQPPERFKAPYANARFGGYWGEISFADEQIGRLVDELGRLGVEERTLVVLTADHGEGLLQHQELTHAYYAYDSTLHVPLILRCPARLPSGSLCDAQVRTVDITPTVLAFLGLDPKDDAQGASLLPLVEGQVDDLFLAAYGEAVSAREAYGYARLRAYRAGGWKYIHAPKAELYDLRRDPGETVNLAGRNPERLEAMRAELEELIAQSAVLQVSAEHAGQLDSTAAERLAALGYVGGYTAPDSRTEEELLREFEGDDPKDHIEAFNQFLTARAWADAKKPEKAVEILWQLVATEPTSPAFRNHLAEQLRALDRSEEAVEHYEAQIELQPANARAHYELGTTLGALGRLEEGVEHLRFATEVMPKDTAARVYLALALAQLGDLSQAEQELRRVLELEPTNAHACTELSTVLRRQGRLQESATVLRKGLQSAPESLRIANNLAWLLATCSDAAVRDGQAALELAEATRRRMSVEGPAVMDTLAAAYAELGRYPEAIEAARRALELAQAAGGTELAEQIQARLELFETGRPFHESPERAPP